MKHYADWLSDDRIVIYLFHGVVEHSDTEVRNYTKKHLDRAEFRELLFELKARGTPLSMDEVVDHHRSGASYAGGSFALTFDDGFANISTVAAPVLVDLALPATFYITSGWIEHNSMSWTDRVEYCLEECGPVEVRMCWDDGPRSLTTVRDKIVFMDDLRGHVKVDPDIDTAAMVEDVFEQCGFPSVQSSDHPQDLKMSWEQVAELSGEDLFTIGGHTHTHPIMTFLDDESLDAEVDTSLAMIERAIGVPPTHYAYPEGTQHAYSDRVIEKLKSAGIVCSPTAIEGVNSPSEDLFHLRRVMVD